MLLKSLEMYGFKSFAQRTKLKFNYGLTAVVGPNGSGKSNISDALRWVLGEQSNKVLRSTKTEDVVFSGSSGKKALGFAEVSLCFDNTNKKFPVESDEVVVTRKYYRSGESIYKINGDNVRLKDINELFMDTGLGKSGYSIIGQGRISEIINAKNNERREFFEEACGVSKFIYKKQEAEKNLSKAEENMLRLNDILSELEIQLNPLKIQSEKAQKYIDLAHRKKTLEISVWLNKIDKFKSEELSYDDYIFEAQKDYDDQSQRLDKIESEISELYNKMQKYLSDIESFSRDRQEINNILSDQTSNIQVMENDIKHNAEDTLRIQNDIESNFQIKSECEQKLFEKNNQYKILGEKYNEVDLRFNQLKSLLDQAVIEYSEANLNFEEHNKMLQTFLMKRSENDLNLKNVEMRISELQSRISSLESDILSKNSDVKSYNDQSYNIEMELSKVKSDFDNHKFELEKLSQIRQKYILEKEVILNELNSTGIEIEKKVQSKIILENYEKNFEGFYNSVKFVMSNNIDGIIGPVSSLIDMDKNYFRAIEVALGSGVQNIVVEDERVASRVISSLKLNKKGRVTLLPLTTIVGFALDSDMFFGIDGFVDIASKLVRYDLKYKNVINNLLGRVLVSENLDKGLRLAKEFKYKYKIVTLDGQILNSGGSITGGSSSVKHSILSRKNDILELDTQIETANKKNNEIKIRLDEVSKNISDADIVYNKCVLESEKLSDVTINLNQKKLDLSNKISNVEYIINDLKERLAAEKNNLDHENQKISDLNSLSGNNDFSISSYQEKIKLLEEKREEKLKIKDDTELELNDLNLKKNEFLKEMEFIQRSIFDTENDIKKSEQNIQRLDHDKIEKMQMNDTLKNRIEELKLSVDKYNQHNQEIENKINVLSQERVELEQRSRLLRTEEKEIASSKEECGLYVQKLKDKKGSIIKDYNTLINKIWDDYSLTMSEAQALKLNIDNLREFEQELSSINSEIKKLGNVNLDSVEEYKTVGERYRVLSGQLEDIEKSRLELLKIIKSLTSHIKEVFIDNFEKINDNFNKIFVEIFGGGSAKLEFVGEDELESGIEIYVRLPGKVVKSLMLLSGGEQSLVAICLYFAILNVRPSPFCVLDEIDAALDDINVSKYGRYLSKLSKKIQFIVITHRRGTMENSDFLYGVTMQSEGISSVFNLDINNTPKELNL